MSYKHSSVFLSIILTCMGTACTPRNAVDSNETFEPAEELLPPTVTTEQIPSDINEDSWARLPLPQREFLAFDGQRAHDLIVHPESRYSEGLRGPVAMWVYSPLMAEHIFQASTYLRYGTDKNQRLTELAILTTARELKSQYEWTAHDPLARRAGLEPEIIQLVRERGSLDIANHPPGMGDKEKTIIKFARESISSKKVSSATFQRAIELFGERGVMDLAGLVGYYSFVNITLKTFDVQVVPGEERLLPELW